MLKILYDGNCIVCDMEISHYKRIAPDRFQLVDIASPEFDSKRYGLTPEAVNTHMHVIDEQGNVRVGVDAFTEIWKAIPKYQIAAKLIQFPGVNQAARVGYRIFARYRHLLPKKK